MSRLGWDYKISLNEGLKLTLKDFSKKVFNRTLPAGFEPAAHCLEGSCSIQLS